MSAHTAHSARWFVRGDIDGFFGLALDNLIQLLVIGSLATGAVVGVDESTVRAADSNRWVFADAPEVIGFDEQPLSVFALDDIRPAD